MSMPESSVTQAPFDPAVIAQMANELFSAFPRGAELLPGTGLASAPPATPPVEVGALPGAATVPPSSAVRPLTEAQLRSLPATLSGVTPRPPQVGLTPAAGLSRYEFRPELAPAAETPPHPTPSAATPPPVTPPVEMGMPAAVASGGVPIPSEAELRALPGALETVPNLPDSRPSPPEAEAYYFLNERETSSSSASTVFVDPYGFHPAMLPDLNLLAGPYDPRGQRTDFPAFTVERPLGQEQHR